MRAGLAALAAVSLTVGGWALLFPHGFYTGFPLPGRHWVELLPAYNEHLLRDFGGMNLGFALMFTVAAVRPERLLVVTVLGGYLCFAVPHLVFHLGHLEHFGTADAIALAGTVTAQAALPAVLLWWATRKGRTLSERSSGSLEWATEARTGWKVAIRGIAVSGALAAGLLVAVPAQAAEPICSSKVSPQMAKRLSKQIRSAVRGRSGTISVAVYDRKRHMSCWVGASRRFDSASTVKVTVVAALLRSAQKRGLTAREKSLAKAAITRSDNGATSVLWAQLGRARIQRLLDLAGMKSTRLRPGGTWGLTQITAHDELRLLMLLTRKDKVLTEKSRKYLLSLMHSVTPSQRWGTPAGAPKPLSVHVKNGWLPRATHGWRVHSLGTFDGGKRDYMMVVLTHGNPSMSYGVRSIERVARTVHSTLNPETSARLIPFPVDEVSDGSAPYGPVDGR